MYATIKQDTNEIEIMLTENFTKDEFTQVIHQLESLCTMYQNIRVLLDGIAVKEIDFKVDPEEFELYKKYPSHMERVAVLGHAQCAGFFLAFFEPFRETAFKSFTPNEEKDARNWVFPSKLP